MTLVIIWEKDVFSELCEIENGAINFATYVSQHWTQFARLRENETIAVVKTLRARSREMASIFPTFAIEEKHFRVRSRESVNMY